MRKTPEPFQKASSVIGDALKLTGRDCLNEICRVARNEFGARSGVIGSLQVVEAEHLFIEAFSSDLPEIQMTDFPAGCTPCHKVLFTGDFVVVRDNVVRDYPKAAIINSLKSRAYMGCPLIDDRGNCLGVLFLEWPDAISAALAENVKSVLGPFLRRITEELRRMTTSHAFETMMSPVDPKASTGSEIFRMIVKQAAELSGVHTVQLVKNCSDDPQNFRILACYSDGKLATESEGESIRYAGTACGQMIDHDVYFHERDLLNTFPHPKLIEQGAQSYLGFGFRDAAGVTIGHIAFTHNRAMSPRATTCKLMQMISSRAGLELQRFDLELDHNAMETALRVRSKLESLGIMAGTIAHDFNNQLAAMIGNTELALLETPCDHPVREYLTAAEESMWRARDVIGELTDFAGNNPSVAAEPIALGEVVSSSLNEFRPELNADVRLHTHIEDGLPNVMGRRVQLIQILSNLISNSLDAAKARQPFDIKVSAKWINRAQIDHTKCLTGHCADMPERSVVLEVCDTGAGMDSATVERVFDPYFSTKGVSRGLGLSSVLGLSKRLGIGLTFDSKRGKGTVFSLYFKDLEEGVLNKPQPSMIAPKAIRRDPDRKSVLVVDDEESVQSMVSKLIETMGHDVLRASSGEEAIKVAHAIPNLDLAIIDVVMSGLNGFETMSELRKMNHQLPTIMVSGFSERNLSDSFVQDDRTKFLVKPFSITTVRSVVSQFVGEDTLNHKPTHLLRWWDIFAQTSLCAYVRKTCEQTVKRPRAKP